MADQPTVAVTRSGVSLLQAMAGLHERRPCLVLYSGADAGRPFDLQPGTLVIGRAPDVGLVLDHPGVSRRHAELRVDEDRVTLADLGSVNGTWVDEVRLEAPRVLQGGEIVRLGLMVFRYYERQSLEAALHDRIYRMATVDAGTEVFNRRALFDTLKREIPLARRRGSPLAAVCIDLDHFKQVNDRHGHAAGDTVLRGVAQLLRSSLQGRGVVGRIGGEEFVLVLPDTPLEAALDVAERARAAAEAHDFEIGAEAPHRQTLSAGVALLDDGMPDADALLAAADVRLYAAKRAGRNRVIGRD